MLNIIRHFEQIAPRFNTLIIIAPAVAAIILGLLFWLSGMLLRKFFLAVIAVAIGLASGLFVPDHRLLAMIILGGMGTVIVIKYEKIFITILAGLLTVVLSSAILVIPGQSKSITQPALETPSIALNNPVPLNKPQTLETIRSYYIDFQARLKQAYSQMPVYRWVIIGALGIGSIVASIMAWRWTTTVCFATLGTLLIFIGMILLLLHKGNAPISHIYKLGLIYLFVFVLMSSAGTAAQFWLCLKLKRKPIPKDKIIFSEDEIDESWLNWRYQ